MILLVGYCFSASFLLAFYVGIMKSLNKLVPFLSEILFGVLFNSAFGLLQRLIFQEFVNGFDI